MDNETTIISGGSVDSVLTSAALLRVLRQQRETAFPIALYFAQVSSLHTVSLAPHPTHLYLVGLSPHPATAQFLARNNHHVIKGIIDEHDRNGWEHLVPFSSLLITPQDRGPRYTSAAAVLRQHSPWPLDAHCRRLLDAADAADTLRMPLPMLASWVNAAIKSAIYDQERRRVVAEHFAHHLRPSAQIQQWVAMYKRSLHWERVTMEVHGSVAHVRIPTTGKFDAFTIYLRAYQLCSFALIEDGRRASIATQLDIDVRAVLEQHGIPSMLGFARKTGFPPDRAEEVCQIFQRLEPR